MGSQQPVEMVLLRQLASYLAIPMWMMDASGTLVYYNEPAEALLGIQFDDVGPIHADQLGAMFRLTAIDGAPLELYEFPIMIALSKHSPAHREVRYCGLDGVWRDVAVSAIPIEGQGGRFHGVLATFWEIDD